MPFYATSPNWFEKEGPAWHRLTICRLPTCPGGVRSFCDLSDLSSLVFGAIRKFLKHQFNILACLNGSTGKEEYSERFPVLHLPSSFSIFVVLRRLADFRLYHLRFRPFQLRLSDLLASAPFGNTLHHYIGFDSLVVVNKGVPSSALNRAYITYRPKEASLA